jgi:hypothetical protein
LEILKLVEAIGVFGSYFFCLTLGIMECWSNGIMVKKAITSVILLR